MMVTQPSIRSKLDQRLRIGFTPARSAMRTTTAKPVITAESQEKRGAYFLSRKTRTSQRAKRISTMILKANAFPVMNGKKRLLLTYKGIKAVRKIRPRLRFRKILVVMDGV